MSVWGRGCRIFSLWSSHRHIRDRWVLGFSFEEQRSVHAGIRGKSPAQSQRDEILGRCTCEKWSYQHWFSWYHLWACEPGASSWLPRGSQYPTWGSQLCRVWSTGHICCPSEGCGRRWSAGSILDLSKKSPSCFKGAWFWGGIWYIKTEGKEEKIWEKGRGKMTQLQT